MSNLDNQNETNNVDNEVSVYIQPTPNPNALKFIVNQIVKKTGKSNYKNPMQAENNELAKILFTIRGVDQLHFFQNVITITKFNYEEWEDLEEKIIDLIKEKIPSHDNQYIDVDPESERRKNLSPELEEIESILDNTIRPGLQGDGGDIQCISYKENILVIKYQGACGTCPSSTTGTLDAIRNILRNEYSEDIEVYPIPS
jgi:NFU1 iron-sulfur cluster scaffold homolog, mitochondrial